jgi:2-isopropylmalate synthase
MEKKLRMTPDEVYEQARLSTRFARNLAGDVEFSPRGRLPVGPDFLCRVLEARSPRAPRPSTSPTPSATRFPSCTVSSCSTCAPGSRTRTRRSGRCTATTTWAWPSPIRWPASSSAGRGRSNARSTALASARATARSRRS